MKNDHSCENNTCNYNFEELCLENYYLTEGLNLCPNRKKTRKSPEEMYASLLQEGNDDNGCCNREQGSDDDNKHTEENSKQSETSRSVDE